MAGPLRGYAEWSNPKPEALAVIGQVREVLEEYRAYLPISLRQIFYRLVAEYGFEKTERAYNRLGNYVARARRAQMIPFDAIRDNQGKPTEGYAYAGEAGFWEYVRERADGFRRDRMAGQPVQIEVWAEAGNPDQLFRTTSRYSIPVYASRGFTSVTNVHALAARALAFDGPTVLLHVGDYDPSGVSIYEALTKDARHFLIQERQWKRGDVANDAGAGLSFRKMDASGSTIKPVRVALTEDQIEEYDVETAPPKSSDSRTATWVGETAQAEALPPDLLARLLTEAIEAELDLEIYEAEVAAEEADLEEIERKLGAIA